MKKAAAFITFSVAAFGATGAQAQTVGNGFLDSEIPFEVVRGDNVSVRDRPRPDYEAAGIRGGSMVYYPSITLGAGYSDNVYGFTNNPVSDGFFTIDPSITAQSDWSRHSISVDAGASLRRFATADNKNEDGYRFGVAGKLNIGDSYIAARGRVRRAYESQISGSFTANTAASVPYVIKTGELRGAYQGARMRLVGFADYNKIDFVNTPSIIGGIVDQKTRDRATERGAIRLEYAATPGTSAFVQASIFGTQYDTGRALGGAQNRDSTGFRLLGGATFDLTAVVRGWFGLGYTKQVYDSPVYPTIEGVAGDIRIEYFMTQLTTVTFTGRRTIEDAVTPGSGGYFATSGRVRIDHELLRNVLLNVDGGVEWDDFSGITRRDKLWTISGGGNYLLNHQMGISAGISHIARDSKGAPLGQIFDETRGTVGFTFQL
ncbi:outer membrane beta-barrel protein [Sphingomonas immobilis]|uniref:Outer membrane beta-barrel protein n=1 Tax=Sphingomonas immobilis TaxID=3063997 RepID=A0ABT9A434_9SPHN|nr:outer membrane beta-barrel protein [Sphingomonas sp. CA1-15]MDO7844601.1 outer membrane beta-barrel protein [Sphingomonas sp. CA1-15]